MTGFGSGLNNFGKTIAIIVNSLLLLIVYFIGVGLTSTFGKLLGKSFLEVKISKSKESYWSDLNLKRKPIDSYYRQF
tara:strand:+ start:484 stop:714 length:231 start_codon:yes stop_codon:yes gene_type:complete